MTGFKIHKVSLCRESAFGASRYSLTEYALPWAAKRTAKTCLVELDGFSRNREVFFKTWVGEIFTKKSGTAEFLRLFRDVVTQFLRAKTEETFLFGVEIWKTRESM